MAIDFQSASNEYLSTAFVIGYPFTICAWFNVASDTTPQTIVSIGNDSGTDYHALMARMDAAGDPLRCQTWDGVAVGAANSTTSISANTWHHGCGKWISSTSRRVLLDGGGAGTNALDRTAVENRLRIGVTADNTPLSYLNGQMAEVGIWDVELTDAEVGILALGYSPLFVRPESLVFYLPMIRNDNNDLIGGLQLTEGGTPTVSNHTRIRYSGNPHIPYITGFVPVGVVPQIQLLRNMGVVA